MQTARVRLRAGFTLLEMMVVLAIIGIAVATIALALPSANDALNDDAARLAAKLELARNRAVALQAPVRVIAADGGYRFVGYTQGQWQDLDGALAATRFGAEAVQLDIDGLPWLGPEPIGAPLALVLNSGTQSRRVSTDGISAFAVE